MSDRRCQWFPRSDSGNVSESRKIANLTKNHGPLFLSFYDFCISEAISLSQSEAIMRKRGSLQRDPSAKPEGDLRKLRKQVAALSSALKEAHARIAALSNELARQSADLNVSSALPPMPGSSEPLLSRLSERERKVAMLFARSGCDKVVAHTLGRAVQTVRNQIASALNKLGLHSRDQLLVLLFSGGHHNGVSDNQDGQPLAD